MASQSRIGANGRDARGRFSTGNAGGPGNPQAKKVAALRTSLLASVTPADLRGAVKALIRKAKTGDVPAIRELLDRTLGKPASSVELSHSVDSLASVTPILEVEVRSPEDLGALLQNPAIARLALSGKLPGVAAEQVEAALRG
ncbi:MAG: hypothetical protein O3C40_17870 [Planctomycetota bacterium]|nr:hypothetical protein [Planctomycetota bacterium]